MFKICTLLYSYIVCQYADIRIETREYSALSYPIEILRIKHQDLHSALFVVVLDVFQL
jgi:hypothetical protein